MWLGKWACRRPPLHSFFNWKHAIYDAMFTQVRQFLERQSRLTLTGDAVGRFTKIGLRPVGTSNLHQRIRCAIQLLFQRTIPPGSCPLRPSPSPSPLEGLDVARQQLIRMGFTDPEVLDLFTAIGTGLTDQQNSNDPGGDRWTRLRGRGGGHVLQPCNGASE